jgi:hypothetical protein
MKSTLLTGGMLSVRVATVLTGAALYSAAAADYPTTVQSYNPLAYWRLDDTAASPALNIVSNSGTLGRAGDGYVVEDVGKGEPGVVGNSIRLNNPGLTIGHLGSRVDVPYTAAISRNFPFTVEFWAKPNAIPASDTTGVCPISCFDNNWYGGANRSGWLVYCNNLGRWNFRLGLTAGYSANVQGTTGTAVVGTWQHIVATYDGLKVNLYANGALIASADSDASTTEWLPNPQSPLRIGGTELNGDASDSPSPTFNAAGAGNAGNRGWDGWVDEVAIYPSVLSAATIAAHHDAASTNAAGYGAQILADSPVGYWNMEEPAVTPPDSNSLPVIVNSGSLGAGANGTASWGALTGQNGSGYGGLGVANKAVFMDSVNGDIAVNDDPALHFTGKITLMAWVKPSVQDFYRDILAHGWDENWAETFLRISRGVGGSGFGDGNYYEVGVTDGGSYYDNVLFPIPPGDIGNWVFLAGTYDGANWSLYRNGALVGRTASANGAIDVQYPWTIGSRSEQGFFATQGARFGGSIDEPAIFNTALSSADITAIYNSAQAAPNITQGLRPQGGAVFEGSTVAFFVWAEGAPTLAYAWYHDGTLLSGQTGTNLALAGVTLASSGTYSVVVSNPYGSATSSVPLAVLTSPPIITQQPSSATRFASAKAVFSVTAIGSAPLAYQWAFEGTAVPGATQSSYTATAQTSGTYTCTVTNLYGTTNTAPVTITVVPLPSGYPSKILADNPVSYWRLGEATGLAAHDYVNGNDGTFYKVTLGLPGYSVIDPDTAGGFGSVNTYVGDISGTAVNFSGHTNFTLEAWVKGPLGQGDESTIIAKGSGSDGTVATEQFALDVVGGVYRVFTRGGGNSLYEADASVGPDGTWQHVVGVYDDAAGSVTIYVNGELSGSGSTRPSGLRTSSSPVTIGSKHLGNNPNYDGYFTGTIDEVAVYNYPLTADQISAHYAAAYGPSLPPSIVLEPQSVTNYISLPASLSVAVAGTVPLTYEWSKNGQPVSGATKATYSITALTTGDAGNYSVKITNANGQTNSALATLTVLQPPSTPPSIPGLVVHLPFDNSLSDATGRGNNGTGIHISGTSSNVAAASYVSGAIGSAVHYSTDTSVTNNTYITLGYRPDLQFSSNVSFSIAFWIRAPLNFAGADLPFMTTTVGSTFGTGLVLAYTYGLDPDNYPGGWAFSAFDPAGNGVGGRGAIGSLNDGNWHHLVHVFDRKNGFSTYLDGFPVGFEKQQGTSFQAAGDIDTGSWFTIGQDPTGTYAQSGAGDIDDVGIWRRAISPLEAASIYMAGVSNQLSFTGSAPVTTPTISLGQVNGNWQITYTGTLLSSPTVNGTYSAVGGAANPYVIPAGTQVQFYRSSAN